MSPPAAPSAHRLDREALALAVPAFGALVATPLFLLVDAAVVGTLGTVSLAALGAAATVVSTAVGLFVFLAYATTAAVARRLGARDPAGAVAEGRDGMALGLAFGLVLAPLTWLTAGPLIGALGASDEVTPGAVTYLRIVAVSFPFMLAAMAGVGLQRGLQDTRITFAVTSGRPPRGMAMLVEPPDAGFWNQ